MRSIAGRYAEPGAPLLAATLVQVWMAADRLAPSRQQAVLRNAGQANTTRCHVLLQVRTTGRLPPPARGAQRGGGKG